MGHVIAYDRHRRLVETRSNVETRHAGGRYVVQEQDGPLASWVAVLVTDDERRAREALAAGTTEPRTHIRPAVVDADLHYSTATLRQLGADSLALRQLLLNYRALTDDQLRARLDELALAL